MRDRKKQRELWRAGVRREQAVGPRNGSGQNDPTAFEAVRRIAAKERKGVKWDD